MKQLLLFFSVLVFLTACADEKIIDETNDTWRVLAATDSPKLLVVEFPSGKIIDEGVYLAANGTALSSQPRVMADFGGLIFLVKPDDFHIEVIEKNTYISKYILDFGADRKPLNIAFAPNATSAYVIFEQDSIVDVIDLTVMQVARQIALNGVASSIALNGNQVLVTCPELNKIAVIDTRNNELTKEIDVPDVPVLVTYTKDGLRVVVVSAGYGKSDATIEQTEAYVSLLDAVTYDEIAKQPLGVGVVNPKEQLPLSLATASRLYAYIGTQKYLLQFNTRTAALPARLQDGKFVSVVYNDRRSEMIFIRDDGQLRQIITYLPEEKKYNLNQPLPEGVKIILPL